MKSYKLPSVFPKKVITEKLAATEPAAVIRALGNLRSTTAMVSASVGADMV